MKRIALFLALLFVVGGAFSQEENVVAVKNEGVKLYQAKKYAKAVEKFQEALKLSPDDADIIYKIGLSAYKAKKYDLAVDEFSKAIENDYKPNICYFYITNIHRKNDNFEKMEESLKQGLAAFPNDKNLKKLAPTCYQAIGLEHYNNAVELQKELAPMAQSEPDKYKVEIEKADKIFKQSLDAMTKAYSFDKDNKKILKALIAIYKALEDEDNANKFQAKLDALSEGK